MVHSDFEILDLYSRPRATTLRERSASAGSCKPHASWSRRATWRVLKSGGGNTMNRPNSLSASIASKDALPDGLLGVSLRRASLVIPALCALAYPSLLGLLSTGLVLVQGSTSPA